jgi:hypothetical protein
MSENGNQPKATTKAAWTKAATHTVRCPSGVYVEIKIPDLPALIEAGTIPQHLLEAAIGAAAPSAVDTPTVDLIAKEREFTDVLVALTVVNPSITEEDARNLPYEDKEMIVGLAMRKRDWDAEGEVIGGLMTSEKFRRFRGLGEFDATLEGL